MRVIVQSFWQSRFFVPVDAVDLFLSVLDADVISIAAFEADDAERGDASSWRIEMLFDRKPDRDDLAMLLEPVAEQAGLARIEFEIERLADTDWIERVRSEMPPRQVARFWLHGTHVEDPPPAGLVPIELDAGLAFGSGEHATTQGCLLALDQLGKCRRFRRVLDMGCGAGMLAIAAAKCWPARILAVDNDPIAVAVAADNAARNGVGGSVRTMQSEGYANPMIRAQGPFDLILSNILADPLCDLARDLVQHLTADGFAVLAGLLDHQAARVAASHLAYGLFLRRTIAVGPWTILIMSRKKV